MRAKRHVILASALVMALLILNACGSQTPGEGTAEQGDTGNGGKRLKSG
ncbi:hypothetical protein WJ0W_000751 [Paenibacillus melissococcoides]|uniref:ABC transporter substrate-binding protein n=1 Tax=Paenibacillus melissococcoides TaxID=2912268 RepID=A0ABM9FWG8_9BACL|nr:MULTISPECIES: hypothetical protein [Paenibacillus]MEB9897099.1 hypothetical protein [Bacillus cereus]CAH8243511.1 hypothetical protein WJ0W_000751 [Paenibacillus melissococcoides]CAH8704730.1 hypothetical protein WDD9_000739 [Paenibacillus melissococcoides]CAH8707967.1 hypothetical protein HTL2_001825 [Paenibacillus melissococcoides]